MTPLPPRSPDLSTANAPTAQPQAPRSLSVTTSPQVLSFHFLTYGVVEPACIALDQHPSIPIGTGDEVILAITTATGFTQRFRSVLGNVRAASVTYFEYEVRVMAGDEVHPRDDSVAFVLRVTHSDSSSLIHLSSQQHSVSRSIHVPAESRILCPPQTGLWRPIRQRLLRYVAAAARLATWPARATVRMVHIRRTSTAHDESLRHVTYSRSIHVAQASNPPTRDRPLEDSILHPRHVVGMPPPYDALDMHWRVHSPPGLIFRGRYSNGPDDLSEYADDSIGSADLFDYPDEIIHLHESAFFDILL